MKRLRLSTKWIVALVVLIGAPTILNFLISLVPTTRIPSFSAIRDKIVGSETRLMDRNGEVIHERRLNLRVRQIAWVPLSEISSALKTAVIQSEDRRFIRHGGADWLALLEATKRRFLRQPVRGASTISMQVAALLDKNLKPKRARRGWWQKVQQIARARELERTWSKNEILEAYLNLVYFRGELQGVASAALGLFGKSASGLNQEESVLLAVLIRSPESSEDKVIKRACHIGTQLQPPVPCEGTEKLVRRQGLFPKPFPPTVALAPHVSRLFSNQRITRSSLSKRLQITVLQILRRQVLSLHDRNMHDGAAIVVDNATGEVVAYVGSIGDLSSSREVDGVRAKRQAGSTLKPFLYSVALEKKYLTPASWIDDSAIDISLGEGAVYRPRDFDHQYHGSVSVRTALASSLNVPAVRTLEMIGVNQLVHTMTELGFKELHSEEFYGPSLALGTADVSLWELVNAYRTLANGGVRSELSLTLSPSTVGKSSRVLSTETAFLIGDILSDSTSRSLTFGLSSPVSLRFWTAVKTGTSKDMRDNWCVGFSSRYTVGVWTGNFSGDPMWNITGISGAAPVWAEIMEFLHESGKDLSPKPPTGVVRWNGEWYLKGTEPEVAVTSEALKSVHRAKIIYPVEGLMIARDPDIPLDHQRILFESSSPDPKLKWVLNNQELSNASNRYSWQPGEPGNYDLKLVAGTGEVADQIHFVVRR